MSGKLIVFEGANEVGKSTLAALLYTDLKTKGIECELLAFPGNEDGTLGRHINDLHHGAVRFGVRHIQPTSLQLLHVAAHIDAIETKIIPALSQGKVVVLDRFWWSTWVYGTAHSVSEQSLKLMLDIERSHWEMALPTVVFLMTRRIPLTPLYEMPAWRNIAALYDDLANRECPQYPIKTVSNDRSLEITYSEISRFVKDLWES
jgi:thymidylate kinase